MTPGELIRAKREAADLSQAQLGRELGISQATIDKIEKGETLRSRYLPVISARLGIPLEDLDPAYKALGGPLSAQNIPGDRLIGSGRDFPIHAAAEGGAGQIIIASEPIDWMPRPSPVEHVRSAYGLYIVGESMLPEYEPGDIALVNPQLPIIPDVTCIFYREREGEARATIKRLRRHNPDTWFVKQWNPPEGMKNDFTLNRKEWSICHRTLGKYSRG